MKKIIYVYKEGASEHFTKSYEGGDCEEVLIEIPDSMEPYESMFDTMIKRGENHYPLSDCLSVCQDGIYVLGIEPGIKREKIKVVQTNGRKSRAFYI